MAYAQPEHIAVGAVVTAAQMQRYTDSLNYLVGNAGAVALGGTITTNGDALGVRSGSSAYLRWYYANEGTDQKYADVILTASVYQYRMVNDAYSTAYDTLSVNRTGSLVDRVNMKVHNTSGGVTYFSYSGVAASSIIAVTSGALRATYMFGWYRRVTADISNWFIESISGNGVAAINGAGTAHIYSDGGSNILRATLGGGSITVARQAGSDTYDVSLLAIYI